MGPLSSNSHGHGMAIQGCVWAGTEGNLILPGDCTVCSGYTFSVLFSGSSLVLRVGFLLPTAHLISTMAVATATEPNQAPDTFLLYFLPFLFSSPLEPLEPLEHLEHLEPLEPVSLT